MKEEMTFDEKFGKLRKIEAPGFSSFYEEYITNDCEKKEFIDHNFLC